MFDFLVQLAIAGVVLALVVLLVVSQDRRSGLRERILRNDGHHHWWNRPRNGH